MGMYTDFIYDADLRKETPKQVIELLEYMLDNDKPPPLRLPTAPLFLAYRWDCMLRMTYAASEVEGRSSLAINDGGKFRLTIRCSLKNYDDEIEKFVEWIDPWVDAAPGAQLGASRFEEQEIATPILKGE